VNLVSIIFLLFFLATLALWRLLPYQWAKRFLVFANFLFYGYWFPPYVLILVISVAVNFISVRNIQAREENAAKWFTFALIVNLGLLFGFKYVSFFLESVYAVLGWANIKFAPVSLNIIFPLGISFYTFQGLSYVIDVYRKKITAKAESVDILLYLSFFPLLTAGPITRANDMLPQLRQRPVVSYEDWEFAIYRICRGLFLKVIIANNLAASAAPIFSGGYASGVFIAWAGAVFFSIQIACDFSGYSDIALGISRLLGFRLPENFNNPCLAAGISDFWRRWHISLTTWFRDYVYLPLSTSRWMRAHIYDRLKDTALHEYRTDINIVIMFLLSGLWHGPAWTFILWGGVHALGGLFDKHVPMDWKKYDTAWKRGAAKTALTLGTFIFVTVVWVPFASASVGESVEYLKALFVGGLQSPFSSAAVRQGMIWLIFFLTYLTVAGLKEAGLLKEQGKFARVESWVYFTLVLLIPGASVDFIYARF
jgi:D-alanyl-lipoteichoic acid acyltransferase DltB (MBOAT superfamily)